MKKIIILLPLFSVMVLNSIEQYYCTAADSHYFYALLNLIGSIHATNYNNLKEIAVYNLGLTESECSKLRCIQKVSVQEVEKTHPDILKRFTTNPYGKTVPGSYAFKPVAIKQSLEAFPYVLWLDSGTTVLKNLNPLFEHIAKKGHFICTIGDEKYTDGNFLHNVGWSMTRTVRDRYDIHGDRAAILTKESIMGGVIGIARNSQADELFLTPLYEMTKDLSNFHDDGTTPNGFGSGRHDQPLMSILAYTQTIEVKEQDHTQKTPMALDAFNGLVTFHMTWNEDYVTNETSIWSSRGKRDNFDYYLNQLKLFENCSRENLP